MTRREIRAAKVAKHLDVALDELIAARVRLGGPTPEPPVEALDAALAADRRYQAVRRDLRDAVRDLFDAATTRRTRRLVLLAEQAANHTVAVAVEVGWRVGLLAGRRRRGG